MTIVTDIGLKSTNVDAMKGATNRQKELYPKVSANVRHRAMLRIPRRGVAGLNSQTSFAFPTPQLMLIPQPIASLVVFAIF
jgi:hypothetical protein